MSDTQTRFAAVYRAELPAVWKLLSRLGARSSNQEDLAHDVFATAFRKWSEYDPQRPVRPWLFGITYRVLLDFNRRHQNRMSDSAEELDMKDPGHSAEETAARQQGWAIASKALASMEFDRRAIFVMHEIDEQPIPEVADALGIPLNTAYSRLRLARKDFGDAVARLQTPGSPS